MNINLLAISNTLAGIGNVGPAIAMHKEVKQSNQCSSPPIDSRHFEYARGTETVDNPQFKNKNSPVIEAPLEFRHTLRDQILPQLPVKAGNNTATKKQNQSTDTAILPALIQLKAAECLQNAQQNCQGAADKIELKAGCTEDPVETSPGPNLNALLDGKNSITTQIEPVRVIIQEKNGPTENPPRPSERPFITEPIYNKGDSENIIQNPNVKIRAARDPYIGQNGDELNLQTLFRAQQGTATSNEKPEVTPVSNVPANQKTPQLVGEQIAPETPVNANSGMNRIGQKQDIPNNQKSPTPNTGYEQNPDKPSAFQPEHFRSGLEKFLLIPEHAIENKASAGEPYRTQTQQFWGPPTDNAAEQGYNSLGPLTYQHLHRAQHQIAAGPIKDADDPAFGNSNPDSGFAAVLSGENSPAYIMEQTSAFSDAAKSENPPTEIPLRNIAAGITEKMLESVHSSTSQEAGNQQITIRLNPPELGKVLIKFEERENQITGVLEVGREQTRYEVERALPGIIQSLANNGIEIKRLEVTLTNQDQQQSFRDEFSQDGLFQHHHFFTEDNNPGKYGALGADKPNIFDGENGWQDSPQQQFQFTENSINILI